MDWMGRRRFGRIMTCRRDLLAHDFLEKHLHKKTTDTSHKTKVARFFQPIACVKNIPTIRHNLPHKRVHVLSQSTLFCKFSPVNSLNECCMSTERREYGQGKNKR